MIHAHEKGNEINKWIEQGFDSFRKSFVRFWDDVGISHRWVGVEKIDSVKWLARWYVEIQDVAQSGLEYSVWNGGAVGSNPAILTINEG